MKKEWLFIFCFITFCLKSFGHEQIVHAAITANAAASAYANSPAFASFIDVISPDRSLDQETNLMVSGSVHEDDAGLDAGGNRSYNHFYDPLDTTYGKGLSDEPPDIRAVVGTNSFVWGSVSNCVGYNYLGELDFPFLGKNINITNIYSWQNARDYELLGLTATNKSDRIATCLNL